MGFWGFGPSTSPPRWGSRAGRAGAGCDACGRCFIAGASYTLLGLSLAAALGLLAGSLRSLRAGAREEQAAMEARLGVAVAGRSLVPRRPSRQGQQQHGGGVPRGSALGPAPPSLTPTPSCRGPAELELTGVGPVP